MDFKKKELLDYLMTSDFMENMKPDEYRKLLTEFRNFYRVISSKSESSNSHYLIELNKLKNENDFLKRDTIELKRENTKLKADIKSLTNRRLSFRERIKGKIIFKNEN